MAAIGILGGTFDPIHIGHLILAEQAWEQLGLEKVLFIPAADPPHKADDAVTDARHRFEMVRLALEANEHFECSRIELDRPGPSYSIDTVRQIRRETRSDIGLYLLVGADEARDFMSWRDPYGIQECASVVVANRPGLSTEEVLGSLRSDLAARFTTLQMPGVDISSTDIRGRVRQGRSITYLVPDAVGAYIQQKGLYRGNQ